MSVFQTTLSVQTYDTFDRKRVAKVAHAYDGRLAWEETERLHEYIGRQGILVRAREDDITDMSQTDRTVELREVVLDYGRAMLAMAKELHSSNRYLNVANVRAALDRDVEEAYGLSPSEWVDVNALDTMPFVPPVMFIADPCPDHDFSFSAD